jgi:hypothetical protein
MKTLSNRLADYMSDHHPYDSMEDNEYIFQSTEYQLESDPIPIVYFLLEDYLDMGVNDALPILIELLCTMRNED